MKDFCQKVSVGLILLLCFPYMYSQSAKVQISGKITTPNKEIVDFATVHLKGTNYAISTNQQGMYTIEAPAGNYTIVVSSVGYTKTEKQIKLVSGKNIVLDIQISSNGTDLNEVVVQSNAVNRLRESAYNAIAIDTKALHNTTLDLAGALAKAPGMKIRESGGVGSDMRLMMDGFTGKHIKVFIDGIPQEGVGGSLGLNKIPINYAERIEVYRGVVPVGFGTDALAGIINVVTNRNKQSWFLDASYSYGSFNTHKSYVNFGQTLKNGFTYEINAFQNYSDNSYKVDVAVEEFLGPSYTDGSKFSDKNIQHVKRFHDNYHNEAVIGKVGVVDKKWADRLMLGFTYSHSYNEIQNGVLQKIVFGGKFTKGHSIMPSLEYRKRDLLTKGLDVTLTANYNKNIVNNVDTSSYKYNWKGEKQKMSAPGEVQYQDSESENNNWNGTFTTNYRLGIHRFTFSHVTNNFRRKNTGTAGSSGTPLSYAIDKETNKNISGLSYLLMPSEVWNVSVFGKYYNQHVAGPVSTSTSNDNYVRNTSNVSSFGYGAAGTYFFLRSIQAKLSYEKAYRLPTNEEMFGDEDLEHGEFTLKPENSDNFNFSLSYSHRFGKHSVYGEGGLIYRNAKDYIQRSVQENTIAAKSYATYQNHGKVETKGYNLSLSYGYSDWVNVTGTYTQIDTRDNVKTLEAGSDQVSTSYGVRMPNVPYRFANSDVTLFWHNLGKKGNVLTFTYDNMYVHEFPLYFENQGSRDKRVVPTQFSHNLSVAYSLENGRYNLSFECRDFTNEKLYDNFSLQKAGRAFYGKFRIYLGGK
ncbi:Outer membrane cobalamin receptor protein [Dysgonomonas macrotermitis]|uniref:Outer membrane cobalamin receptor protein n=2 Tax=Dysgonomonas macrotermitis TaxID=1346286 RepID=A0A1M5EQ49_9BACT|nr:Outer membrane cobalamin receptor protein [Dysgonomonas macrotermitis]